MTRHALAALTGILLATGCRSPLRACGYLWHLSIEDDFVVIGPGERKTMVATMFASDAGSDDGNCSDVVYDSQGRPAAFHWASSDTSVVSTTGATIVGRAAGTAWVRVISADQIDSSRVTVALPP